MSVQRETELKLELEPAAVASFRREAGAALGSADTSVKHLNSVYYDTRKHALRRRGLSLRVRREGERRVQTLKADGQVGAGMFARPEWEKELTDGEAGPVPFDDQEASAKIGRLDRLAPVFETQVERTAWIVEEGSSTIEIALDEGTVARGEAKGAIAEVELELKRGSPADLFEFARRLADRNRLRLAVQSKSERGYDLLEAEPARSFRSEPVALTRSLNAVQAFQAVARSCVRQFRLNETALVQTRAPEALHQARVAVRRFRSALTLFSDVIADKTVDRVKGELRSLATLLGEARDIDVYRARVGKEQLDRELAEPGPTELLARLEAERERAYDAVLRKLGSKRFRMFMIDLTAWIETGPWLTRDDLADAREESVRTFAASVLDRRWRKVRKKGRRLDKVDEVARHEVRIDTKKLRYASEFFAGLVRGAKAKRRQKRLISACEEVQARLGELNDMATGAVMAKRLSRIGEPISEAGPLVEPVPQTPDGAGQDVKEGELLAAAVEAHQQLVKAKPFWR